MATNRPAWAGLLLGALVTLAGCGGGGGSGDSIAGPSTSPSPTPDPSTTTNPYADDGDTRPTKLSRLVVFGDSYSNDNQGLRPGVRVWSNRLGASAASIFARSNATAGDQGAGGSANDLRTQVDRWLAAGISPGPSDLAAIYVGYNDIQLTDRDLAGSLADYRREIDRLLTNGAGDGHRKLLVTLVHDWSQVPRELERVAKGEPSKRGRVDQFNRGVVAIANSSDDVLAVDLRTVFDRIAANPRRYELCA